MDFLKPQVGKARKPKFELHLKIYDLNNVPLVSGHSQVKWHLTGSMHAEHRGRTAKSPIANHRVDYSFVTLIPSIRISIDRNNNLVECPFELEIVQEFGVTEKMSLGFVRLNLSEYVEESEAFTKDVTSPGRKRSSSVGLSPAMPSRDADVVEDGIVRRYLLQDSKVNSTLKIGILMIQVDGERSYVAPALKTAPVFGGIGGIMGESIEDDVGRKSSSALSPFRLSTYTSPAVPSISKPRDAAELQDLYRHTLAASWCRQPNELPADECVEDIFNGGNGWKTKKPESIPPDTDEDEDDEDDLDPRNGTLRPQDVRRIAFVNHNGQANHLQPGHVSSNHSQAPSRNHRRTPSNSSDKSVSTVTVTPHGHGHPPRKSVRIHELDHSRSMASLTSTMTLESDQMREVGMRRSREVPEHDIRNDLIAWKLPGAGGVGLDV
ncbi:N-terminal C2 in EEIG1 and EHBP1 proteins-domain-containing protein [Thelonectria olida]|uniref:N-terminal C2 in EEIG1 and EHBP1 proteins-domain-containing protein n=1 Tax=Thelonectria olida TaxID=1576542 RepID=A0A9P8W3I1_9HYPO|nr:N-terminal C2 in EEIG1 and EHBP1 proteins-domain-containing protein [Thelonectria olida]